MKLIFEFDNYIIEVYNDSAFDGSPDSPTTYENVYVSKDDDYYMPNSKHAIAVYDGTKQVANAILLGAGGATSVHKDSAFLDENNLIVRCSENVFSLALPDLKLNWMTQADPVTCFAIYKYDDSYISHGEISVSRINRAGEIIWQFGSGDIFVKLDSDDSFRMEENYIYLKDFSGKVYKIDYDGRLLNS